MKELFELIGFITIGVVLLATFRIGSLLVDRGDYMLGFLLQVPLTFVMLMGLFSLYKFFTH